MHSEDSQPIINKQGGIQLRDGHPAQRVKKLCKKLADQSNELGQLCSPSGTFCRVLEARRVLISTLGLTQLVERQGMGCQIVLFL